MERIKVLSNKNQSILYIDFSNLASPDMKELFKKANRVISNYEHHSLYLLTNFTNAKFNSQEMISATEYAAANRDYVKASAVFGIPLSSIKMFEHLCKKVERDIKLFETEEEAKAWLFQCQFEATSEKK
ncbi:MAG: STAS/SEC14 domain-containing protein [Oligoflexia bacterium]|nr:STAS/SEC14 domain-containing protein [Oligoflexia bacterium]MBF0366153.1 STAS/SEC14 domain-containing protein [Oligoflexia bacterium]